MSLILDALKKLERDRGAREPNVLVVGSVPWGARARSRLPLVAALVAAGLLALLALVLWPRGRAALPPAVPSPAAHPSKASDLPDHAKPAPAPAGTAPAPRPSSVPSGRPGAAKDGPAEPATSRRDTSGADEYRLNAISQRDGRPVALINDRLVFEGDGFDGVKVLRIGETEVEIEVRGVKRVLRF